jgi:hypothetical protein
MSRSSSIIRACARVPLESVERPDLLHWVNVLTPEYAQPPEHRVERLPQLVRQHRQELVLPAVRGLCLLACRVFAHQEMRRLEAGCSLRLVEPRPFDGEGGPVGHEPQEAEIVIGELAGRSAPRVEDAEQPSAYLERSADQ